MICQYCSSEFKTNSSLNNHMKNAKYCIKLRNEQQNIIFQCGKCNKILSSKYRKETHEKICNSNTVEDDNKLEIRLLKQRLEDKDNMIKELNKERENITSKIVDNTLGSNKVIKPIFNKSLVLNDITIIARPGDGFINATQLCQAGGKEFSNWYSFPIMCPALWH